MNETEENFWLKKRGPYPYITYRGGAMKSIVNIKIPLDEIGDHLEKDEIKIRDRVYTRKKGGEKTT